MRQLFNRVIIIFVLSFLGFVLPAYAQVGSNPDSINTSSIRTPEQVQAYNDSIAALRTYMKSKAYNDSLDRVRKARMDSIRAHQDALKLENQRLKDSMQKVFEQQKLLQQQSIDSIKRDKQRVVDSLNEIKKYRTSKGYKDSVDAIRQKQLDSLKQVRQLYMDSVKSEQKRQLDSMKHLQQVRNDSLQASIQARNDSMRSYIDSLKAAQAQFKDSMEMVKQNRIDSLEKMKDKRLDEMYEKDKQREQERKDREREKVQKARDNYTNDVFLKKNWGLRRRIVQNTFTRYNYYYNATNKIKEAENNMYMSKIDNFDSTISLYPYDPSVNSSLFANDMDTLGKRLSVGIQIHDPRSKWQDDLFFLLGQSYYYKGDFENAAAVFEYVINYDQKYEIQKKSKKKNDKKDKESNSVLQLDTDKKGLAGVFQHDLAKNDAIIWLSRSYLKMKEFNKAQILLDMIIIDPRADKELLAQVYETYAHLYLERNEKNSALPYLDSIAFNTSLDKRVRQRASYLGAQLYTELADWENAEKLFTQVTKLNAPIEMDLNAQLNKSIAQAYISADNYPVIVRQLKKMTKEDKFKQYTDRIYLALGQTYVKKGDNDEAIEAFNTSIQVSKNNPLNKALAFYELGQLYYNNKRYVAAQSSFDSAAFYYQSLGQNEMYNKSKTLAQNLSVIAVPAAQIEYIDSLLNLTKLSDKEKQQWARKEVKKYEQSLAKSNMPQSTMTNNSSNKGGFYFSNSEQIQKGRKDFQQTWGDRPLVNNWRRSNDIRFVDNSSNSPTNEVENATIDEKYFISKIPTDPNVIDSLNKQLEKSYVELEKTFYLTQDYSSLKNLYKDFIEKYPSSSNIDLFYHDLYMVYFRENNADSATYFKELLSRIQPESPYLSAINNISNKSTDPTSAIDYSGIEQHMDQTYSLLQAQLFKEVVTRSEEVKKEFPVQIPRYQAQYNLMKAIAYAGLNQISTADTLLTEILKVSKDDSLKLIAQDVLNYIRQTPQVEDTTSTSSQISFLDPNLGTADYTNNKSEKHYVLLYVEKPDNRMMPLRAGIMDYNSMNKSDLELRASFSELKNNSRVIVIKELKNDPQAKKYISDLKQQKVLFKDYNVNVDIKIVSISESNFILLMNRKDFIEYLKFYNKNY